jgi:hypothetical protein
LAVYLLPTIIACRRQHHQRVPIVMVNLLAGWTGLAWIAALVWSVSAVRVTDARGRVVG